MATIGGLLGFIAVVIGLIYLLKNKRLTPEEKYQQYLNHAKKQSDEQLIKASQKSVIGADKELIMRAILEEIENRKLDVE